MAETTSGAFSTLRDYVFSNPDSETTGLIITSKISRPIRSRPIYTIRYTYTANYIEYISAQVNYTGKNRDAYKVVEKYPVGKQVTVYYDSTKPQYAILEKTSLGTGLCIHVIAIVLITLL